MERETGFEPATLSLGSLEELSSRTMRRRPLPSQFGLHSQFRNPAVPRATVSFGAFTSLLERLRPPALLHSPGGFALADQAVYEAAEVAVVGLPLFARPLWGPGLHCLCARGERAELRGEGSIRMFRVVLHRRSCLTRGNERLASSRNLN